MFSDLYYSFLFQIMSALATSMEELRPKSPGASSIGDRDLEMKRTTTVKMAGHANSNAPQTSTVRCQK